MTIVSPTPGEAAEFDTLAALAEHEHRAGRLADAAAAYRKILTIWPDLAEAYNIPCEVPYLAADATLTEQWRRELAGIEGFKIGIAWQGACAYLWDRWRSIPLADFAPLARLPGVRLISLQKGFGSEQMAAVDFPVLDLSGRLDEAAGPFMDTAAVMCSLDLVGDAGYGDRPPGWGAGRARFGCAPFVVRMALAAQWIGIDAGIRA